MDPDGCLREALELAESILSANDSAHEDEQTYVATDAVELAERIEALDGWELDRTVERASTMIY